MAEWVGAWSLGCYVTGLDQAPQIRETILQAEGAILQDPGGSPRSQGEPRCPPAAPSLIPSPAGETVSRSAICWLNIDSEERWNLPDRPLSWAPRSQLNRVVPSFADIWDLDSPQMKGGGGGGGGGIAPCEATEVFSSVLIDSRDARYWLKGYGNR